MHSCLFVLLSVLFFFSSRRRHTRWPRDWIQTCALPISPSSFYCKPEGVTGIFVSSGRGTSPDTVVTASSQDHRIGVDEVAGAIIDIKTVSPKNLVICRENVGDIDRVQDRDLELFAPLYEAALNL